MKKKALYFPYIRVPQSAWLTRMLLYWDKVGSIVPYDYIEDPSRLGEYTRSLVEHELIEQVMPGRYVNAIPDFDKHFGEYLNSLGPELDKRRESFFRGDTHRIHMEKMGDVEWILKGLNLARRDEYPWYNVESETADDFMFYLAAGLGGVDRFNAMPVTDTRNYISRCLGSGVDDSKIERQLEALRLDVLENVFPSPKRPLSAEEIKNFKDQYGDKLVEFRRSVERELVGLADIENPTLRQRRLELFYEEIEDQIEEISARMGEGGFGEIFLGKFCGVVAAIPGVSAIFGLASAIYNLFAHSPDSNRPSHFAYAAYAQVKLLNQ